MNLELDAKRTRVRLLDDVPVRRRVMLAEVKLSPWVDFNEAMPPCNGMWEVRPYKNDAKIFRAVYNLVLNSWVVPGWPFPRYSMSACEWRGLASDPNAS